MVLQSTDIFFPAFYASLISAMLQHCARMLIFLEGLQSSLKRCLRCSSTEVEIEMFVKSHAGARKRLAQEETKLAEQREKSKEKKVGKPFCQWREG